MTEQLQQYAPHLTSRWRQAYQQKLLSWFDQHRRDLPWRRTRDAYAIWISETMLQQTQVATVIDYYHRFLNRFPTVQSLAAAEEQEVLGLWAGLGYYRRARQLHAAAKQVVAVHAGQFPADVMALQDLPGVGRYTAGAIASIAYDLPAPIVEANTQRVYARLLKHPTPSADLLWQFAQWQLPDQHSGQLNQAAMELGSLVCKPAEPLCLVCPIKSLCPTVAAGLQQVIPAPKPKKQFTSLHHAALVIESNQRWLVRQNPAGAWWHGLWDFPRIDISSLQLLPVEKQRRQRVYSHGQFEAIRQLANAELLASMGKTSSRSKDVVTEVDSLILSIAHGVTRYRIQLDCFAAEVNLGSRKLGSDWQWADRATLEQLPLTSTAKKMVQRLLSARPRLGSDF